MKNLLIVLSLVLISENSFSMTSNEARKCHKANDFAESMFEECDLYQCFDMNDATVLSFALNGATPRSESCTELINAYRTINNTFLKLLSNHTDCMKY